MEFFQEVHSPNLDVMYLKNLLIVDKLTNLCASINNVISHKENECDIYCIWGAFKVRREEIKFGVRFSLLDCPHALAWTITFNELNQNIVIHCTIDKTEQDSDFVDSIYEFIADWSYGIKEALQ